MNDNKTPAVILAIGNVKCFYDLESQSGEFLTDLIEILKNGDKPVLIACMKERDRIVSMQEFQGW